MDDVTFWRNGPYGDAWIAGAESDVYQCLVSHCGKKESSKALDAIFFNLLTFGHSGARVPECQQINKSAQSNLGRGPRRGAAVAQVRRKVPIGYNGVPQIRLQKYPFPWTDSKTPLPASSLDPYRPMMPNGIRVRSAVFPQCTGQTDVRTDAQTDISSTGKFGDYRPLRYELRELRGLKTVG